MQRQRLHQQQHPYRLQKEKAEVMPGLDLGVTASPANEWCCSRKVKFRDYYLQELSVSDSYFVDTTPINIHLEYKDAETKTIEAKAVKENTQTTNVVSKVGVTGSKRLPAVSWRSQMQPEKKIISWTSGDKDSVKVYVTEKDGYQNFKYSFDEKESSCGRIIPRQGLYIERNKTCRWLCYSRCDHLPD